MNLVLFGPPGSGKGTQSQLLVGHYRLTHISTGDALRAAIRARTPLGLAAKAVIERGELVSDEMVTDMLRSMIRPLREQTDSFLFDGYPRTIQQLHNLDVLVEEFTLTRPAVINLQVSDETLVLRMTGRRICAECKNTFNVYFSPPKNAGVCDVCQGPLLKRVDDNVESISERLRIYHEQSGPVLAEYESRGQLITLDGTEPSQVVFAKIGAALSEFY